ncbi:general stress protein [Lederbergia citrea]|uniref:General stress protein n=1 Tax=Lederbergia citrea TaxID=2833581 RepID=A0A942UL66_9BACI|nr:general stress protein [Lederbergia citrea]MBS4177995.1 general stress protein [Lederbergia citrea]MBS4204662.1 general stress protein [Lederbergia citrea]MBS4223491.1 general stress protein [Lederbergia citrea]
MNTVKVCENGVQAVNIIEELTNNGYDRDNIYLFAHGEERSKDLTDATDTGTVGVGEQGILDSVSNVFRKRGDELRSKFESVGLTEAEAEKYEKVLDGGQVVVVATN